MRRAHRRRQRRRRKGIGDVMTTRQRQQHIHAARWGREGELRAVRRHMDIGRGKITVGRIRREAPGFTRPNDALPVQPVVVIGVQNGDTVFRQAGVNLAFRFRHAFQRTKAFQMRRREVIHQRRLRACQAHGPGDFALVVCP